MSTRNRKVRVWGRFKPTSNFAKDNIEILGDSKSVNVHLRREAKKGVVNNQILDWSFKLDGLFNNVDQEVVYNTVAMDIVKGSLDGYNGTIMCYGQTGAGKTFTMTGATESYRHRGVIPRAISQLFKQIEERLEYSITVRISYLEIYNEGMFDLLGSLPEAAWNSNRDPFLPPEPMVVSENQDGVFVKGLSCHLAQNEEEALNLLFEGETNRSIAAHQLNKQSSRSHCIFTIYLESRSRTQSNTKFTVSKVHFVDLAGSERLSKTKSEGKTKEEALYINKSLSFLEQVVIALAARNREHVPFRQSKLTHYLKDSIGGNCNTLLIANMWAEKAQIEETVSTLRFATRMMCVQSEPCVNEIYDPALLVKKLQREIQQLKSELAMHDTLTNRSMVSYEPLSEQQKYEIRSQVRRYLEGDLDELDIVSLQQISGTYSAFKELYKDLGKDIEAKLKEKYILLNKSDPQSIVAAQQALENFQNELTRKSLKPSEASNLLLDDQTAVGELEGNSFSVGNAPKTMKSDSSTVVQLKKKERERERDKKKGSKEIVASPIPLKPGSSSSHSGKGERKTDSPANEKVEREASEVPISPVSSADNLSRGQKSRPEDSESTPPSRTSAFEDFKSDKGIEINRILIENKGILASKKKEYSDLANFINNTKHSIDESRKKLDEMKAQREAEGPILNEDGDIIITEEEFNEIQRLKELKANYRKKYDELHNLKSEVVYCQKLVDQCRLRLIQEFDNWYSESFLGPTEENQTSVNAGIGVKQGLTLPVTSLTTEDEQEKFERLQLELMMNNPESAAYYNAKMRTAKRKMYGVAMDQPQPAYRRQIGTPTISVRNKPPNLLQVQY
ncbi:kinesin-like protein KIF9 isoform X2 [Physella acuta]|uniref:kinesin-like protein KIF9 isoform X2 n=1 Tax=Physella acuta TaxID=109671 RepID=UPI0027DC7333|nr:kinesin-like protein KIF9 isoform X2 [Physella acuta]